MSLPPPKAPVGRAVSPTLPRPLLGTDTSADRQHQPRTQEGCSPLSKGTAGMALMGVSALAPAGRWVAKTSCSQPCSSFLSIPSRLPFLHVFLIFLPSVLLGSLPGYFQQWLSLPAREGMDD